MLEKHIKLSSKHYSKLKTVDIYFRPGLESIEILQFLVHSILVYERCRLHGVNDFVQSESLFLNVVWQ